MRSFRPVASALRAPAPFTSSRQAASQSPCLRTAPSRRHQSTSNSPSTSTATPNARGSTPQSTPQTHFDFFPTAIPSGPPPTGHFTIDTTALKREFLQLQARAHPDLHPPESKSKAQALSARINEAYKTLQNPLLRAQYLLSLRGVEVAADETAKVDDPELLMEVLEARERIEEAGSEEELVGMKAENGARIAESVRVLEGAFAEDDVERAKGEAVRLRYWINIQESLDGWERGKPVVLEH
ncbi:Co-chaperone Hsc20 [Karstenula rhodostoma CBS 690.94]|uniref:Co-chaperone Hsc20 n=1 Tax=Karstenula rhodostoma CBS 690.94 TaxID=1392251 RepID=A0A9P4U866_9PLEO|nr:Co-chaperone Hsc20 [Karstenula rhodostoma CBS 690.94]